MTDRLVRPPFDPELESALVALESSLPAMTLEAIPELRDGVPRPDIDDVLDRRSVARRDVAFPGYDDGEITITVLSKAGRIGARPAIYHLHAGGGIAGDRFLGIEVLADWVDRYDTVVTTLDYRLAPEFPIPYPVEDAYAGLIWMTEHAAELGIDPARILLEGNSYGGSLAAGIALMTRDRNGPSPIGQLLMYPELDDRHATPSAMQYADLRWDGAMGRLGWSALLGDRVGSDDPLGYSVPARAADVAGLPPTFASCGSAESCRDEVVEFVTRLWAVGVQAELHVWAGGFHGFEGFAPESQLAASVIDARDGWMRRMLR